MLEASLLIGRAHCPGLQHFRTQKPALAKSSLPIKGSLLPPSFSPRPQPGLPNAALAAGGSPGQESPWLSGPVHPGSMLLDRSLSQLPAWQRLGVWCGAKAAPTSGREGGSRARARPAQAGWTHAAMSRRKGEMALLLTGQRRKLRLREVRSGSHRPARGELRPGSPQPGSQALPFCFVLRMGCRGARNQKAHSGVWRILLTTVFLLMGFCPGPCGRGRGVAWVGGQKTLEGASFQPAFGSADGFDG